MNGVNWVFYGVVGLCVFASMSALKHVSEQEGEPFSFSMLEVMILFGLLWPCGFILFFLVFLDIGCARLLKRKKGGGNETDAK